MSRSPSSSPAFIAALACVATLSGCGSDPASNTPAEGTPEATAPAPAATVGASAGASASAALANGAESTAVLTQKVPNANVLMVVVDTLRADALGTYGQALPTSPNIDAFAKNGVVFDAAWTPYTWTLPAYVSYMTSRWARSHGWRHVMGKFDTYTVLDDRAPTLATVLQGAGYATNAQVANPHISKDLQMNRGFDVWVGGLDKGVLNGALADLKKWPTDGKPNFLYLHFMAPHVALKPSPEGLAAIGSKLVVDPAKGVGYGHYDQAPEAEKPKRLAEFREAYHAAVHDADARFGALMEALAATGEADRTVVVFFSDHGEMLGTTGVLGHGATIREEVTRVPLLVSVPGQAATRVTDRVGRLVDVAPTIADAVGVAKPAAWEGRSLYEAGPALTAVSEREGWTALTADAKWKLLMGTDNGKAIGAFDLAADPDEKDQKPVAGTPAEALVAQESAWRAAVAKGDPGPTREKLEGQARADEQRKLEALGYIDTPAAAQAKQPSTPGTP